MIRIIPKYFCYEYNMLINPSILCPDQVLRPRKCQTLLQLDASVCTEITKLSCIDDIDYLYKSELFMVGMPSGDCIGGIKKSEIW